MSMLVASEVAELLRCNTFTARRLMSSGEIEAAKIAGKWVAKQSAVEDYIESMTGARTVTRRRRRRSA